MTDKYDVGYGKPPKQTQFQKGKSGNPNGRPKRRTDMASALDRCLSQVKTIVEDGKPVKLTIHDFLLKRLVLEASRGNMAAIKEILKLIEENSVLKRKYGHPPNPRKAPEGSFAELLERARTPPGTLPSIRDKKDPQPMPVAEKPPNGADNELLPLPVEIHQNQKD
jgi:hypothetical protein